MLRVQLPIRIHRITHQRALPPWMVMECGAYPQYVYFNEFFHIMIVNPIADIITMNQTSFAEAADAMSVRDFNCNIIASINAFMIGVKFNVKSRNTPCSNP
jgi:hypothetical protein